MLQDVGRILNTARWSSQISRTKLTENGRHENVESSGAFRFIPCFQLFKLCLLDPGPTHTAETGDPELLKGSELLVLSLSMSFQI